MATASKTPPKASADKGSKSESTPSKKAPETPFTASDLARECGLESAALARRYLRAAQISKPQGGWNWPSRDAAKSAVEAVKKAREAEKPSK